MKKLIGACLCIILVAASLSACSQGDRTEPSAQESENLYFHLDSLPDIGKRKDNSFVNKYWSGEAKNEFIPDANYKGIVPYVFDKPKYYSDYDTPFAFDEYSYGLATIDGEIITNGIYSSVISNVSNDNKQIYICTEKLAKKDDSETFVDIIAADGSWKIRSNISPYGWISTKCDLIPVAEKPGSKIYDFDGKLIFDSRELFGEGYTALPSDEIGDDIIFEVSDKKNIFNVSIEDEFEDSDTVYAACVDRNGKLLYTVKPEGYRYTGVCGDYFKFSRYESIYDEYGNLDYEFDNALFDKNGNKLLEHYDYIDYDEVTDMYVVTPLDDSGSIDAVNDSTSPRVFDRNMNEVCQIETNGNYGSIIRCNGESCLEVYYYPDEEKSGGKEGVYLYDLKTGKEIELPRDDKDESFEMDIIDQFRGDAYLLINDGQYVSICDIKGKTLKKLSTPYIEINDIHLEEDIFYYMKDSILYLETLDTCDKFDLKSGKYASLNLSINYIDDDLIYLISENQHERFVYNKKTEEFSKAERIIDTFNTQSGTFTLEETDYYLNLLNENGECIIRKTKSF